MTLLLRRDFLAGAISSVFLGKSPANRFGMIRKLTAHPGKRDVVVKNLSTAAELVGNAQGCELYVVHTSTAEPDAVWVTEVWRSKEDHDASLSLPGVRALVAATRPLIAGISQPILTIPVGGKGLAPV